MRAGCRAAMMSLSIPPTKRSNLACLVRHPMYSSMLFFGLGVPLLLGALSGLIVSVLMIMLIAVRAVLEERTLAAELPGYADYVQHVRYRLVPKVW